MVADRLGGGQVDDKIVWRLDRRVGGLRPRRILLDEIRGASV